MSNSSSTSQKRVLSGMRPTGMLHLGNYMGALHNWVRLQHHYDCYFFIADWHALTTDYADTSQIAQNIREVALDWLGAGLDPEKCVMFVQSHVKQHAELHLLLSMIAPLGWLERVPTYKEQQENLTQKDLNTYGFLGYPLLQSADILIYQANLVPVGQDQVAHVEITREIARRFNFFYSEDPNRRSPIRYERDHPTLRQVLETSVPVPSEGFEGAHIKSGNRGDFLRALQDPTLEILPEPEALLTPSPKLPGTDGRKMSKSYGNTILLTDSYATVSEKLRTMFNGGQRALLTDPGDPERCPVAQLHGIFSTDERNSTIRSGCRSAGISCVECKQLAADSIWQELRPIQERRSYYELHPHEVDKILLAGASKARNRAEKTMRLVRRAMGLNKNPIYKITALERMKQEQPRRVLHSLSNKKVWWNLERSERGDKLRDYWKDAMLPHGMFLRLAGPRLYVSSRNKRVFVATAREKGAGHYRFVVQNKSYEVLVLLAWAKTYKLRAFVIPQKEYRSRWTQLNKSEDVQLRLRREGNRYLLDFLSLPESEPIDISLFEGDYTPIR